MLVKRKPFQSEPSLLITKFKLTQQQPHKRQLMQQENLALIRS
jgi:hypothetical protein